MNGAAQRSSNRFSNLAVLVFAVLAAIPAQAQQQVVRPPIAVYWLSAERAAGLEMPGMGGMGSIMGGLMGQAAGSPAQGGKRLVLQLGSQQTAPAPRAEHAIPPAMAMGESLPLVTPERPRAEPARRGEPGSMERPKGRMLIYWGCGETLRPGQPVVLDFSKLAEGQMPPNFVSRSAGGPTPPGPGRSRTYGDWPNAEQPKPVPENASLRGDHAVRGNYSPEIRFALGEAHDFMPAPGLRHAGGGRVQWQSIAQATGYFATLMGSAERDEVVFWSSSEVAEMGPGLMDYIAPGEVARLVREKVVLPPGTTECVVPAEVLKRAGTPFLNFIAYGPEANFVHPPRPADPKVAWEQQWAVKARFKSTAQLLLGEAGEAPRRSRAATGAPAEAPKGEEPRPADGSSPLEQGIRTLRGILGR